MKKKVLTVVTAIAMALAMVACGAKPQEAQPQQSSAENAQAQQGAKLKIGILQLVDHVALDAAKEERLL